MKRSQLEHVIRAAATITQDDDIVVIGSQAVLGQFPDAPEELCVSDEADLYPRHRPERSDLIDGSIGEGSPFHITFGYYAQGVGVTTATLPRGWETRLVPVRNERTRDATGWCLEVHDLVISKLAAGREKDMVFTRAAARHGLVRETELRARLDDLVVDERVRAAIAVRISRAFDASPGDD